MRPDFTDMQQAARVSSFMEEGEIGRWRLRKFSISREQHAVYTALALAQGGPHAEHRVARTVPPGDYICLSRRMTAEEVADYNSGAVVDGYDPGEREGDPFLYTPIMSDTPDEIREHDHAFSNARGKVLITGLGLGVLVSALLAKPCDRCQGKRYDVPSGGKDLPCRDCEGEGKAVSKITVIEVDRDVIALTGPYYENDPRVEILNYDARDFPRWAKKLAPYERWDYAWHDIWSHIAERNLTDDDLAEHGLSYATMFKLYEPIAARQAAWAYPEAVEAERRQKAYADWIDAWGRSVVEADRDERITLILEFLIREQVVRGLPLDAPIPVSVQAFAQQQPGLVDKAAQLADDDHFIGLCGAGAANSAPEPMARPNEAEEANVAGRN